MQNPRFHLLHSGNVKILLVAICLFLLPFILVSLFNQPAIDDFWSANTIISYGRLGAVVFYFNTHSARFFSNFLMSMCNTLPSGSTWIFKIWPIITILLLAGSFYFLYSVLFGKIASKLQLVLASLFFVLLHIANMRVLFEGLYWMSSSICYQIGVCLFAVGVGAIIRYIKSQSLIYACIAVCCSAFLPGSAEVLAPVYIFVLAVIIYASFRQNYQVSLSVICLLVVIGSLTFISLSKGNSVRLQKNILYNRSAIASLFYSTRAVGYYCFYWLTTPINIAALILLLPVLKKMVLFSGFKISFFSSTPLLLIPVFFFVCVVIYLPLTYFESLIIYPRITTVVFFVAVHLALAFLWIMLQADTRLSRFVDYYAGLKNFKRFTWAFFIITVFTSTNFLLVAKDLFSANVYVFNKEANMRYAEIIQAKGDTCYVNKFSKWPYFIQYSKQENYSFDYMNIYFGKTILYKNE